MADLGRAALVVSLGLTLYAFIAGTIGALQKRRRLSDSARNALVAAFGSTVVASIVLAIALVHHDFSFVYVYTRYIPPTEMARIHADPFALFAGPVHRIVDDVSGGGVRHPDREGRIPGRSP